MPATGRRLLRFGLHRDPRIQLRVAAAALFTAAAWLVIDYRLHVDHPKSAVLAVFGPAVIAVFTISVVDQWHPRRLPATARGARPAYDLREAMQTLP